MNDYVLEAQDVTFSDSVLASIIPVVLNFRSEQIEVCRISSAIFASVAPKYKGRVLFAQVDVDKNPAAAEELKINTAPMLAFFGCGKHSARAIGAISEAELEDFVERHLAYYSKVLENEDLES